MALAPYYSGWATNMGITTQTEKLGISIEGRSLIRQRMRKKYSWEEIVFIPLSKIATNLFLLCDKCWVTMCFFSPNRKMFYVSVSKKSFVCYLVYWILEVSVNRSIDVPVFNIRRKGRAGHRVTPWLKLRFLRMYFEVVIIM